MQIRGHKLFKKLKKLRMTNILSVSPTISRKEAREVDRSQCKVLHVMVSGWT